MEWLHMEWASLEGDGAFERDDFYESIQAPRWLDFSAPIQPVDDHAWFCGNAGCCTHVKDAETASATQESMIAEPNAIIRGAAGRRTRNAVSSSYSAASCIKEACAQRKVLHVAKMPHKVKGQTLLKAGEAVQQQHASENQNPNQSSQAQADRLPGSRKPVLKAPHQVLRAGNVCGQVGSDALLPLTKSGKPAPPRPKDAVHKSGPTRCAEKDHLTTTYSGTSDRTARQGELTRAPFSHVYTTTTQAPMSNPHLVVIPSVRPAAVARLLQYDLLKNQKKAKQPPRLVAGKGSIAGAVSVQVHRGVRSGRRQVRSMVCGVEEKLSKAKQGLCVQDQQTQKGMDDDGQVAVSGQPMLEDPTDNPPHQSSCQQEEHISAHSALEKYLENLHLSVPSDTQETVHMHVLRAERDAAVPMDGQKSTSELGMAVSEQERCSSSTMERVETSGNYCTQMLPSCTDGIQGPMKDGQRSTRRGLKRKSSELNFQVKCSSKDHGLGRQKAPLGGAPFRPPVCHEMKLVKAPPSALSCHGLPDSCKEQHKRIKTTEAQPFKPFRLRTEERAALKELGLVKKEAGGGGQTAQEELMMMHQPLRMPSFTHTFRPQRSTKKLTVPKEPNFHSSRARKTCTGHASKLVVISSS